MTQLDITPKPNALQQAATLANLIYGTIAALIALGGIAYGYTQHLNAQDVRLAKMEWEMSIVLTLTDWRTKTDQNVTLIQDQNEVSIKDRAELHRRSDTHDQALSEMRDRLTRLEAKGR